MTGPDGCVHDVPRPAPRVSASEKPAGIPVGCGGTQAEPKIYHSVANNYRVDDRQLVVNCTGRVDLPFWFRTHEINGRHDFYLMYLTSGRMTALVDGKEYDVQAGDAVIFPPGRGAGVSLREDEHGGHTVPLGAFFGLQRGGAFVASRLRDVRRVQDRD